MDEGSQKVQTPYTYKIKFWGCNVMVTIVNNTVWHI